MDIKKKALEFAIKAHGNQLRKAETEKPAIVHIIDVGNILESYGFDDNVVASGYLHDILEDTEITKEDILREFGSDIYSLVIGASEEDRSLSWEERKLGTINRIKNLDFRHKAVVLADKISNTEDLINLFGRQGKKDFSSFNRGKDKKIWYWTEAYKSLANNQDESHPLFKRLKHNLDTISSDKEEKIEETIFNSDINSNKNLKELYYKRLEILKLKTLQKGYSTYVCCLINNQKKETKEEDIKNYFNIPELNTEFLHLSWTQEEISQLLENEDDNFFRKEIDKRLHKLVLACKSRKDFVFISSNLLEDLSKYKPLTKKEEIKKLKTLKYYLDVISRLINNIYLVEENNNTQFQTFLNSLIKKHLNTTNFNLEEQEIDSYTICRQIVDDYKKEELKNIKKLIKKYED